jgi:hypothetical protein
MHPAERLIDRCLAAGPAVRYVAVYRNGELHMRQRAGLTGASSSESDRYEELLVNPTLLTLARQRGEIDCGGLEWILLHYGHFFTVLIPVPGGHVNVGLELDVDLGRALADVREVVASWAATT